MSEWMDGSRANCGAIGERQTHRDGRATPEKESLSAMAVKIRLMRMGMKKAPYYRVVVADSHSPRDGRFIENIGIYHPNNEPSRIEIDTDKAREWLAKGAQPTEAVARLLAISGIEELAQRKQAGRGGRTVKSLRRLVKAAAPPGSRVEVEVLAEGE